MYMHKRRRSIPRRFVLMAALAGPAAPPSKPQGIEVASCRHQCWGVSASCRHSSRRSSLGGGAPRLPAHLALLRLHVFVGVGAVAAPAGVDAI